MAITILINAVIYNEYYQEASIYIWMYDHFYVTYIAVALIITIQILILCPCCSKKWARKVPINYILLLLYTLGYTYLLCSITLWYEPEYILIAASLTGAMFLGLTAYACFTKKDLTKCIGVACALGFAIFMAIILSFFFWSYIIYMIICVAVVILMALYILIDT